MQPVQRLSHQAVSERTHRYTATAKSRWPVRKRSIGNFSAVKASSRAITMGGFPMGPRQKAAAQVIETISGSVAAGERLGFRKLQEKHEADDVLIVTKLDRLGRNGKTPHICH